MNRLIYTAMSGMNAAMNRQRAVANNLANVSTAGFRAEQFSVTPVTIKDGGFQARVLSQGTVRGANMDHAAVSHTGQPLDIAMAGDTLLTLQAPDGSEVYSRRGDLSIAATGILQNGDGLPVMSETGPITVPAGSSVSITEDGSLMASDPAAPNAPARQIGAIKLANPQGSPLLKDIDGFLRVPGGGVLPGDPEARVITRSLEGSNVDTATALVQMIEAQRSFEQRTSIISTASDLDQASSRLMSLR